MTADEFVERLRANQPTAEKLLAAGVPAQLVDEIRASYCIELQQDTSYSGQDDPIVDLIKRYDTSTADIGSIRFRKDTSLQECENSNSVLVFADFDADMLAIDSNTGKILLLDGCQPSFVMMILAHDGGRFFDALIALVEGKAAGTNPDELASQCATISGADQSEGFYHMLAG